MGMLVGSYCTSHILMKSDGVEDQARAVVDGFTDIGRSIRERDADLILLISADHYHAMPASGVAASFVVGLEDSFPVSTEHGALPAVDIPSQSDFGESLVRFAADSGFDMGILEMFQVDHGFSVPSLMIRPERDIPIVPLFVNSGHHVICPSPKRCYELGKVIASFIETTDKRVAVVAGGGLSHWVAVPEMGRINEDFDRHFLDLLRSGQARQVAEDWTVDRLSAEAGNGGLEILNWLIAVAAAGDRGGDVLYYEPIEPWLTGLAAFRSAA